MGTRGTNSNGTRARLTPRRLGWLFFAGSIGVFALAAWMRHFRVGLDLWLYGEVEITTGFLALTFAVISLVRFRGTSDRLSLILGCGFVIVGVTRISSSFVIFRHPQPDSSETLRDPTTWVIGCTILALVMVAAVYVERRQPRARHPLREIAIALWAVLLLAVALSSTHEWLPADFVVHPGGVFPGQGISFPAFSSLSQRSDTIGAWTTRIQHLTTLYI